MNETTPQNETSTKRRQNTRELKRNKRREAKKAKADEAKSERKRILATGQQPVLPPARSAQLFRGQLNAKKLKANKPVRVEQWVDICVVDGVITITRYPDNAGVIKRGQQLWPPPTLVYRRLNFPDGIPPEYEWTGVIDETHRKLGGCGIQRMKVEKWLEVIEKEAQFPDGRILPVPFMPRPRECGECSCQACQRAYAKQDREQLEEVLDPVLEPAA